MNSTNEAPARRLAKLARASFLSVGLVACARPSSPAPKPSVGHFGPVTLGKGTSPLLPANSANTVVLAIGAGISGDRVSGLLEIPSDQCAVIIARAGASIEDVDLDAYGEDGSIVGTDAGPDKTPSLLVCPPHPARVWVSARIASGHGLVAVGAERLMPGDAGRAAALYGIHSEVDPSATSASGWPALDERLQAHRRDIGGIWQDVRRVVVPLDARLPTRVSAQVDAGHCVDVFVAPGEEVGHLEVSVLDSAGSILGRAPSGGRDRGVVICSPLAASLTLELRPQSGRGSGVFALSRSRDGSEGEIESDAVRIEAFPELELDAELEQLESALSLGNGYARGKKTLSGSLEVGRRSTQTLKLGAGCSRLDVQGAKPLRGLAATLWSTSGELIARSAGGGRATLFACVGAGAYRLDVEATLRPGPFALVVHAEKDVPSALLNHPLAAGRLLSQVVSRGVLRRPSEIGQVTAFDLSDTELKFMELTVPFGRCMDVALGLDKDGLGAEVRLVAVTSGAEVALGRGAHGASARVCSLDAASSHANLKTRVELRVAAGAGTGLVATRMLSPTR